MNKTRILITALSIFITLSVVFMINKKAEETVETVSLPVTGKTIVLDARTPENLMREQKAALVQLRQKQI